MMRLLCSIFAVGAILGAQESQPDTQVGDLLFKMPPGWSRVQKQNVTALIPPGLPPGKTAYLALFPAAELKSGLREWFDAEWATISKDYRVLEGGQATPRNENGMEGISATAAVTDRAGTRWAVFFGGIRNGTRVQPLLFMSSAFELYEQQQNGLRVFFTSVRLSPAGPAPPEPREAAVGANGRLDGIYREFSDYDAVANKTRSGGYRYQTFYPDGRYVGKLPDQGMDNDDTADMRLSPLSWGTYTLSGNQGTVQFPVSMPYRTKPDVMHFTVCQGGHMINATGCQVDPTLSSFRLDGGDGAVLRGTFHRPGYQMQYGPKQGIAFTADGHFADEGFLKAAPVVRRDARGNFGFDDGVPGRGTYHVGHYTLTLSYSDGRVKRVTFYMDPGASKTDVRSFYISTWQFIRVN
jgi:hypothetical protein